MSIHVCDDEIFFFPSPIVAVKIASPSLVELVGRVAMQPLPDDPDESNPTPFDESSNQMDTSFGDSFVALSQVCNILIITKDVDNVFS